MPYTTLSQARAFMRDGYGQCDNSKLTNAVNKARAHFYSWYEEVRLFLDAVECFAVQTFCQDCNACNSTYQGVTLPRHHQNVEAMWWNDWPVALKSSWREFQVGISPECECRLQKFDVPGSFSTAVDIAPRTPRHIIVKADSEQDEGKRFVLRGTAATGEPFTQEFVLSAKAQKTSRPLMSISGQAGIVKDITEGRVLVAEDTGRVLLLADPDETVPSYRRIKITGLPENCPVVNIRSARRYQPVYGDDDAVETDSQIAWDAMARYLRIFEKSDRNGDDLKNMQQNYALALKIMMGNIAREEGKGTQAEIQIGMPVSFGSSPLNRMRTARRW